MDFFANAFQERVITPRPSEQHRQSQREIEGHEEHGDHIVKDGIAIKAKETDPPLVYTDQATVLCEICGSQPAKYKCPGCLCQTCSLPCSKQHKVDTTCSGQRSRTHFVDRKTYSEQDMMSDYNFLQEMGRLTDNAARENLNLGGLTNIHRLPNQHKRGRGGRGRGGHHGAHGHSTSTPLIQPLNAAQALELQGSLGLHSFKDKQLVRQAKFRGTQLTRMAEGLQRHKDNQSYWNTKYKNMIWTIEWLFPEVQAVSATTKAPAQRRILAHRNIDTHTLKDLLSKQLLAPPPSSTATSSSSSDAKEENAAYASENKDLADRYMESLDQCRLFLQIPLRNKPALYQLNIHDTLQKALTFKKVLEYPTILVFGPESQGSKENGEAAKSTGDALLEAYTIEETPTAWPSAGSKRTRESKADDGDDDDDEEEDDEEEAQGDTHRHNKKAKTEDTSEAESSSSSDDSDSSSDDSDSDQSSSSSDDDEDGNEDEKTTEAAATKEGEEEEGEEDGEEAEGDQTARLAVGQAVLEAFAQDFGEQAE